MEDIAKKTDLHSDMIEGHSNLKGKNSTKWKNKVSSAKSKNKEVEDSDETLFRHN